MKFGENLYNLRKVAKMSQEKLAEKMQVTRQSVSKWENGESYPEMEKIMKLCDISNIELKDNTIIFKGSRIDDRITITEEKANDSVTLSIKINDKVIADEKNQDMILQIKNVLENNSNGKIIAFIEIAFVCLMICLILYRMALIRLEKLFININQGETPFTLENVRYIKQIAKIMIIVLALPTCGGIIFEKILRTDLDVGFELFDVVQILFLFGISYIFEYGYELQQDTKAKMYGEVSNNE